MQKIKINLKQIKIKETDLIVSSLKHGKVIVYPTDTIYGLGCIATDNHRYGGARKPINNIYKIKRREKKKPLLVLVSSFSMLKKYCYVSKAQEKYLKKVWPGPVSVILKSRGVLPKDISGGQESIAVRLPKSDFLIKIIKGVKQPIVSTSLNINGKKNLADVKNIEKNFKKRLPDLIIDAGSLNAKPSKLIDLQDIKNIKILRK